MSERKQNKDKNRCQQHQSTKSAWQHKWQKENIFYFLAEHLINMKMLKKVAKTANWLSTYQVHTILDESQDICCVFQSYPIETSGRHVPFLPQTFLMEDVYIAPAWIQNR